MPPPEPVPSWMGTYAGEVAGARGDAGRLARILHSSLVPMVLVDDERRYVEVNQAAALALGMDPSQLVGLRIDDVTPPYRWPTMKSNWERLMSTGSLSRARAREPADGGYLGVTYYAMANALPGHHMVAFAPPGWLEADDGSGGEEGSDPLDPPLTPRELEVLRLAAEGRDGPGIARELTVSDATVRTHFANIYSKLGVRDRAGAVAKALRLGLIE